MKSVYRASTRWIESYFQFSSFQDFQLSIRFSGSKPLRDQDDADALVVFQVVDAGGQADGPAGDAAFEPDVDRAGLVPGEVDALAEAELVLDGELVSEAVGQQPAVEQVDLVVADEG